MSTCRRHCNCRRGEPLTQDPLPLTLGPPPGLEPPPLPPGLVPSDHARGLFADKCMRLVWQKDDPKIKNLINCKQKMFEQFLCS